MLITNVKIRGLRERNLLWGIIIKDGIIVDIKPAFKFNNWKGYIFDAQGLTIMPGMVNAHLHSNETFLSTVAPRLPLELWAMYIYPGIDYWRATPEDAYIQALVCAMEMVQGGITSVVDNVFYPGMDQETYIAVGRAYADVGIKADIAIGIADIPFTETFPAQIWSGDKAMLEKIKTNRPPNHANILEFMTGMHYNHSTDHIRFCPGPSRPQRCTEALWDSLVYFSKENMIPLHTHCYETKYQKVMLEERFGNSLVEWMARRGDISKFLNLVHCVWLEDWEYERIKENNGNIILCPVSNMMLDSGVAPISLIHSIGVNWGLGSDGLASNTNVELKNELAMIESRLNLFGNFEQVYNMGATGGARIMSNDGQLLNIGSVADFVLIEERDSSYQVLHSFSEGKCILRDGNFVNEDVLKWKYKSEEKLASMLKRYMIGTMPSIKKIFPEAESYYRDVIQNLDMSNGVM